jgi:myo-inositol-1(or 4)-monophosphatase
VSDRESPAGDSEALLEVACETARMAGGLLLERARGGAELRVSAKSTSTDLVSDADLAAEHAIREHLRERRPNDGFLGEEGGSAGGSSGLSWIVDPLDGTVNFLFEIPQWCVSVAVRDDAGTVAGVVFDPNRGELFSATREGPARLSVGGSTRVLDGVARRREIVPGGEPGEAGQVPAGRGTRGVDLAHAMVATGLSYSAEVRAAQARVLARTIPRVRDIRRFGSAALDLTWTALGRYDAYFERSVKVWDIAAGALICERAGLDVLELPVHENLPWGILAAPPGLSGPLLGLVGGP